MKNITLCRLCNKRYGNEFKEGDCYICKNRLEKFISVLKNLNIEMPFFTIESIIPKEAFINEEEVLDFKFGISLKHFINKAIVNHLTKKGFKYRPSDYLVKVIYDWDKNNFNFKEGDVFIYGKYWKLKQFLSQKIWKRKKFLSLEELIGDHLKPMFESKSYFMHASGREDVDALNTAGRPFVIELRKIKRIPNIIFPYLWGKEGAKFELYGFVPRGFVTLVSDSHFDKCYRAYIDKPLNDEEIHKINNFFKNITIEQQTPTRVIKRRADKLRKRKVYRAKAHKYFIDFETEAGLYIKELISGDGGRTQPSVSQLIGKELKCIKLIVTCIKSEFLDFMFQKQRLIF